MTFHARCPVCKLTFLNLESADTNCVFCGYRLRLKTTIVTGPMSEDSSSAKKLRKNTEGGSPELAKSAINRDSSEKEYVVVADHCDLCHRSYSTPNVQCTNVYKPIRVGGKMYAACESCYSHIETVRVKRDPFSLR